MSRPRRPARVFDAHLHIIDPRFPLVPNEGFVPEPFTVADYRVATEDLAIAGGAVVTGSFQGTDQTYLRDALSRLGPGFVGVTRLPPDVSDDEIVALEGAGVRAARLNLHRGGQVDPGAIADLAHRIHDVAGWHVELYVDSRELAPLVPTLAALPQVVIDHLGLSAEGFDVVLELVEEGAVVKASGFGRLDLDVRTALEVVAEVDAAALVFGTDLPSTRARRPFAAGDLDLLIEVLGDDLAERVCWDNAVRLYRPDGLHGPDGSPG
jgi:predicted TIM-barrel fold metal-dependent hydrolase